MMMPVSSQSPHTKRGRANSENRGRRRLVVLPFAVIALALGTATVVLAVHPGAGDIVCGAAPCYGSNGPDDMIGQPDGVASNMHANDGADWMNAQSGPDDMNGDNGQDFATGESGYDEINGNEHDEIWDCGTHYCALEGGPGADLVNGGPSSDYIDGNAGQDILRGADGADSLFGSGDNDADTLNGGTSDHHDHCYFDRGDDTVDNCHKHPIG